MLREAKSARHINATTFIKPAAGEGPSAHDSFLGFRTELRTSPLLFAFSGLDTLRTMLSSARTGASLALRGEKAPAFRHCHQPRSDWIGFREADSWIPRFENQRGQPRSSSRSARPPPSRRRPATMPPARRSSRTAGSASSGASARRSRSPVRNRPRDWFNTRCTPPLAHCHGPSSPTKTKRKR